MRPLAVLLLLAGLAPAADKPLVFHDVTVIDVAAGRPVPNQTVVVTGSTVAAVRPAADFTPPADATVIDGRGKYLTPGLWDSHVHIADAGYHDLFLANGVTAVRDLYAFVPAVMLGWRDAIAAGKRTGPRMLVAGSMIDGKPNIWPTATVAETPEQGRAAVRAFQKQTVDLIKVYESLTPDVYRAIMVEAKAAGLPVDGHVPQLVSAAEASDLGQRTMEHLTGVLMASSKDEAALRKELAAAMTGWKSYDFVAVTRAREKARDSRDPAKESALFATFKANRTWHTPTLVVHRFLGLLDDPAFTSDPRKKYLSPFMTARWTPEVVLASVPGHKPPPEAKGWFAADQKLVGRMHAAGVGLLAGTDCTNPYCFPGFSLHDELEMLVGSGLTPAEALKTATLNPAAAFGLSDKLGTVAVGKTADLLLLDADPLADIRHTTRIAAVVANGRHLSRADLDGLLAKAEGQFKRK